MTEKKAPPTEDLTSFPSIVENLIASAPVAPGQIELHEARQDQKVREIRDMEDRLLLKGFEVLEGISRFGEVDPKTGEVSNAMVDDYGHDHELMTRMKRMAQFAQIATKDAPVGITVMSRVVVGLVRARAQEKAAPRKMNVAVLHVGGGLQLPTQKLEDE